jgi:hypothetical protein
MLAPINPNNKVTLVGGLENFFFSHHIWNVIIPTDDSSYFPEG